MTGTGPAAHPHFFSGLLTEPAVTAAGMLAVAAVARASYHTPANVVRILRDPVVTSDGDRLRFESFLASLARRGRSRLSAATALLAGAASAPAPDHPEAAAQALAALLTRAEAGESRS